MRFPLYIAWRYLFAKKTHTAINTITMVSVVGVAVGSMALVVVLSVFNGFEKLILSMFNAFHADIEITVAEGKTFSMETFPLEELVNLPGVANYSEVLEEMGMVVYQDRQHLARLRGVDETYRFVTGIDTMLIKGEFILTENDRNFMVPGQGVYIVLNANINDYLNPIDIYVPRRGRTTGLHPSQAFRSLSVFPTGVFAVQTEYDMEYIIVPLRMMRRLLDYDTEVTSIVLRIDPQHNHLRIQRIIQEITGPEYVVRNRLQQQDFLYRVMRSERWAIFFILTFILIIAAFNITGSLSMLVIEKRRDIAVLRSMGAGKPLINKIFLLEGILISIAGGLGGILFGGLISWLQMRYGFISLQAEGVFIMDAYPVFVKWTDLLLVKLTVFCIGMVAALIPVKNIWRKAERPPH
ncbi:MAG: ABC transporter permease [Bacteroidia bacterium]|nr:MAG: ABC transporter permease [Bacteroidia bacterium]